ncbi:MAG: DoxX family protein, partial [Halobaculum sp.]
MRDTVESPRRRPENRPTSGNTSRSTDRPSNRSGPDRASGVLSARAVTALLALVAVGSGVASAHVDYVTDGDHPVVAIAEFLAHVFASPVNVALLAGGALATGAGVVAYLRYADRFTDVQVGIRTLKSYRPYLPWMLRLSLGLPLVGAGFTGYYFSPAVPAEARLLQVFLGFMLLFGLATRLVAAAGLVAYLVGLVTNPALLLASEYVAGFLGIVVVGPGQPSADMLLRRITVTDGTLLSRFRSVPTPSDLVGRVATPAVAPVVIRAGLGVNFLYL